MSGRTALAAASATRTRHRSPPFDVRAILDRLAVAATFAAVAGLFAISPIALEMEGIAYIDAGGGLLAKIHPASVAAASALVFRCLAARRPVQTAWRIVTDDAGVLLLVASTAVAAIFAVAVDGTPVSPLVDTFGLTALVFVLLRDIDRRTLRTLALVVGLLLCCNAAIAVFEFLRGVHLIAVPTSGDLTDDPTKANAVFSWKADLALDWRAEALLGHPLVNGLVVGSFLICLASPAAGWIPLAVRVPVALLQMLSMFCFGARTALVLAFGLSALLIAKRFVAAVAGGMRLRRRAVAPVVLVVGGVLIVALVVGLSGFGDKTLDRFGNDNGSAATRLTMFALFDPISMTDLMLHPDKDLVATLQRVYGLEFGIESSWIGLILTYGAIVAAIMLTGILALWRSIDRVTGAGSLAVAVLYLTLISVTASLSGKTTSFAMIVALLLVFLRKDLLGAPAWKAVRESRVHGPA